MISIAPIYVPGPGDGQPGNLTLPGSGFAVPAGLEAVLEYNGLLLNVQKNVDRYKITNIDGTSDADVRDTREANTDDDGETPYNSFYGGHSIVISGTIQTYSIAKLRDMQQALRAAFVDIRNEYPLYFRTGDYSKDHYINCKKVAPISGVEQQAGMPVNRDFQITLRASNPRFLSYYQHMIDQYPAVPTDQASDYPIATITNIGNFPAQPIFRIYGPTTTGVTFANQNTGDTFTIAGGTAYNDYLEFNPAAKTLKSSDGTNQWNMLSDDSDYMTLQGAAAGHTGENVITYYGDASRVQIWWNDSWL